MKESLIKSILEKLAFAIIGGLSLVCMDWYADFRGVEYKDIQISKDKDYKLSVDSTFKAHNLLIKLSDEKTHKTLSNIRQMIKDDKELTIEAIQIAEDSIIIITPYQTDSIRNILLKEWSIYLF